MLFANDNNGNRVSIDKIIVGEKYYCPLCNNELTAKMGDIRIHHFAHKKGLACHDTWHYDMSEWHKNWQSRFPEECQEIVRELDGKKHRADVLLEDIKTVIEFQHSKINGAEFCDRNNFYKALGYKVVWLFDLGHTYEDYKIKYYTSRKFEIYYNRSAFSKFNYYDENVTLFFQIQNTSSENETIKETILCIHQYLSKKELSYHIERINDIITSSKFDKAIDEQKMCIDTTKLVSPDESVYKRVPNLAEKIKAAVQSYIEGVHYILNEPDNQ